MLNEQLKTEISQEAKSSAADFNYFPGSEECEDLESVYTTGAEKYAEKWQEAQQRVEQLAQWKKETKLLLDPILDWGQSNKNVPLGASITEEVLRRAKGYDELKAKVERYEKALNTIGEMGELPDRIKLIIERALTPKTGSDE